MSNYERQLPSTDLLLRERLLAQMSGAVAASNALRAAEKAAADCSDGCAEQVLAEEMERRGQRLHRQDSWQRLYECDLHRVQTGDGSVPLSSVTVTGLPVRSTGGWPEAYTRAA